MNQALQMDVSSLFDAVRYRASAASGTANATAFTYLNDGENISAELSFAQLDFAARALAARLQEHTTPHERVLLVYPPGIDYIVAFFACVYAGVTAVPALPPANARTLPRLRLIAQDAGARVALTLRAIKDSVASMHEAGSETDDPLQTCHWLASDEPGEAIKDDANDDANNDASNDASDDANKVANALAHAARWQAPVTSADDIVFLQYTSGSTGAPKGVMVSNHNLLANLRLSQTTYGMQQGQVMVSWLPPHHDFGLIGAIISPVWLGCHCVQFPPAAFLMRPVRWLKLISAYRARMTGAPNFAWQLCVARITEEQKQSLDLSCLEIAVNGAERIRMQTLAEFAAAFANCGLRPQALTPAYGMAECVLLGSANMQHRPGQLPLMQRISKTALEQGQVRASDTESDAIGIVATGSTELPLHRICIANVSSNNVSSDHPGNTHVASDHVSNDSGNNHVLADGCIGEVCLQGPSVARGYWNNPAASLAAFGNQLAGQDGTWLRSGDLGYISDGQLYITGRIKEMMIFNGRNVYPQDVEITVEQIDPAFRANGCAVFALEDGTRTQLVILQEVETRKQADTAKLIARLRTELAERHDILELGAVLLLKSGRIPRTSSGKLQRLRCKQLFVDGEFDSQWRWDSRDDINNAGINEAEGTSAASADENARMLAIWQTLFEQPALGLADNFFQLGGHSLLATQLITRVNEEFGIGLPLRTLFHAPSAGALANAAASAQQNCPSTAETRPALPRLQALAPCAEAPLSWAQQRFWFLDQYQSGNAFYSIPLALSIRSTLERSLLEPALNALIARHSSLRTVFPVRDGVARQQILPAAAITLGWQDLRQHGSATQEQAARAIAAEAAQPFDLAHGPLLRASVLQLAEQEYVLLLTLHHIVHDGWSTAILLRELSALYAECRQIRADGIDPATLAPAALQAQVLAPLPLHYPDYAIWEQQRFADALLAPDLAFWRDNLAEIPALLALPTDRVRPALMSHHGAAFQAGIDAALLQQLQALAHQHNATLFMVLTAAMQVLLARLSGQSHFCIGALSANRPPEAAGLIGNFVNVVPLKAAVNSADSFADLLGATARNVLAVYERQLPFELILNHLAPQRGGSSTPYAQVVLNFHNEFEAGREAPLWQGDDTLQITGRHVNSVTYAAFELKVEMNLLATGLDLVFEYNTGLFDAATIERFNTHFQGLLASLCAQPGAPLKSIPLLTPAEMAQLRAVWQADVRPIMIDPVETTGAANAANPANATNPANAVNPDRNKPATLADHLNLQAARSPHALAVVAGSERLTYADLHGRANHLAQRLQQLGVGPDSLVGICTTRSVEMIIAVLAVVKAGGAYLPLDPAYPPQRLQHMLQDAAPVLVLTQAALATRLPLAGQQLICLDQADALSSQTDAPVIQGDQHSLAYVIYTSGSTGKPKGTMVTRRGLQNLLGWFTRQFAINADDRFLLFSSFSFDLTQKNIFAPLLCGGQLHLPPEEYAPQQANALIAAHAISVINCAPSAFYPLLDDGAAARMPSLRHVFLGGEPIAAPLLHAAWAACPHAPQVHNTYGPTEASDVVSWHSWHPHQPASTLPIGRAIANTRLYVLDADLNLLPDGCSGELFIGGAGVGRGYLNQPALSEARFLPDPWAQEAGARMYKTGDLVRCLPNGELDYLGRIDHQVKVRGFRIELGEIEECLNALPQVAQAVVMARNFAAAGEADDTRLVAWVVASTPDIELNGAELRNQLAQNLPHFMLPGHVVQLPAMPQTPNGKVDRQALPMPDKQHTGQDYMAPQGETETALAAIWRHLLQRENIGRSDHFFHLGGHSLLATRLAAAISKQFGVELALRTLFEVADLASQAQHIAQLREQSLTPSHDRLQAQCTPASAHHDVANAALNAMPCLPPLLPSGAAEAEFAPLSHAQQRLWLLEQFSQRRAVYNLPFALKLDGEIDIAALQTSLNQLLARHEALRTAFVTQNGSPQRQLQAVTCLPLQQARLSDLAELADLHNSVDLTEPADLTSLSETTAADRTQTGLQDAPGSVQTGPVTQEDGMGSVLTGPDTLQDGVQDDLKTVLQRWLTQHSAHAFDLQQAPLARANLLQLAPQQHVLLLNLHHIIADGWSLGILTHELSQLYRATRRAARTELAIEAGTRIEAPVLPALPLQYSDFALWQRQCQEQGAFAAQLDYWRTQLADAPAALSLPLDRPRPLRPAHQGGQFRFAISAASTRALTDLAQAQHATLFMGLNAVWSLLLSRYAGQTDICIGTPIANRPQQELEGLIGFFVNTLVLRVQLDGVPDFASLLTQVRDVALGAYANQDLPFDQLVASLQHGSQGAGAPLFQVMLALQNAPLQAIELDGLEASLLPLNHGNAKFDLTLNITPQAGGLQCELEYDSELFNLDTVQRMASSFITLLEAATQQATAPLATLPLLPPNQQQHLLQLGRGRTLALTQPFMHRLFESHAARAPQATALVQLQPDPAQPGNMRETAISYGQLNQRANRLAHALLATGVAPGQRVALYAERGIDMVLGLLAILKSGAAYVPFDPLYPAERLSYMLRDSQPVALLTQTSLRENLLLLDPLARNLPCLLLDAVSDTACGIVGDAVGNTVGNTNGNTVGNTADITAEITDAVVGEVGDSVGDSVGNAIAAANSAGMLPDPLIPGLQPNHPAYVIYTSGSTGLPKGVLVPHQGLANLAQDQNQVLGITPASSVLQFASISFDASIWEIAMALASGARLILAAREVMLPGQPLLDLLRQQAVSHTLLPPALLAGMHDDAQIAPLTLLVGGEACPPDVARHWGRRHRFINAYGPSEITVCASTWEYRPESTDQAEDRLDSGTPIGRPLANTRIYILDANGQLVPRGVAGEIWIGGQGVAIGYLNRPDLSRERFCPDPFHETPGQSMYKSGDLARWLPDGQLQYLGRNDFQVKIRGFRIELGEVESALCACPGVASAVVIARNDGNKDGSKDGNKDGGSRAANTRLVAYVVAANGPIASAGASLSPASLRSALKQSLPEYMLPQAFVLLDALPQTVNGKLDRAALPPPDSKDLASRAYVAPQQGIEQTLAAIWQTILEVSEVGRFDHFFELGGHSLALTKLGFMVQEAFGVNLSLAQLYELPELQQLARHIGEAQAQASRPKTTVVLDLDDDDDEEGV